MKLQQIGMAVVSLGVLLLIVSFAWKYVVPQSAYWTDDQAVQLQDTSTEFHSLTFREGLESPEFAAAKDAYESQRDAFDQAISRRDSTPMLLRVGGLGITGVGIVLILVQRIRAK